MYLSVSFIRLFFNFVVCKVLHKIGFIFNAVNRILIIMIYFYYYIIKFIKVKFS